MESSERVSHLSRAGLNFAVVSDVLEWCRAASGFHQWRSLEACLLLIYVEQEQMRLEDCQSRFGVRRWELRSVSGIGRLEQSRTASESPRLELTAASGGLEQSRAGSNSIRITSAEV